jgi:hypothetical protein
MANGQGRGATMHDARLRAWSVPPRRLARIERRLRRRHNRLTADQLTRWYAARAVLRERGVRVPPVTRQLP